MHGSTLTHSRFARPVLGVCAALLVLAHAPWSGRAFAGETGTADLRGVQAAFVVNFLAFAEWPAAKLGPSPAGLIVAVIGDPDLAAQIAAAVAGRQIGGRPVSVRTVARADAARDAHLVFIGESEAARLPGILRDLATASVLTVGSTDGFAREGVALNLYTVDRRVRIEANSTAAARAGIRINANLMRLARIVE